VPLGAPQNAKIVNRPRIFMDEKTGNLAGLWQGGNHGEGTQTSRMTNQCHDITVFPSMGLAAGACSGNGLLMDISDPVNPKRLDHVVDKAFSYWHSATFNNDGTKVVFTDEWGGGSRPRCRATDPITWGADAIFDIVDKKLQFKGYYKMPAPQTDQENCVAHNGSLIPVPGRDIMVQSWYQGGVSVFDFTDSANPVEIAFFDRGPLDAAAVVRWEEFNSQQQPKVTWPATAVVAKAYIDQLNRTQAIQPGRARAVVEAMERAEGIRSPRDRGASAAVEQLDGLVAQLESDANAASGADKKRLVALADTLKGRAARLR